MPPKRKASQSPSKAKPAFTPSPSPDTKAKTPSDQRIPSPREPPPIRQPNRVIRPSTHEQQGIANIQANVLAMRPLMELARIPRRQQSREGSNTPPAMKKGGLIKNTGIYKLHKGEVVIPSNRVKSVEKALKEKGMKPLKK